MELALTRVHLDLFTGSQFDLSTKSRADGIILSVVARTRGGARGTKWVPNSLRSNRTLCMHHIC